MCDRITDLLECGEEALWILGVHLEAAVSLPPLHVVQVGSVRYDYSVSTSVSVMM